MQRAREHRLERQLYVAQILPGAQQRVSIPIIDVLASYHIHIYNQLDSFDPSSLFHEIASRNHDDDGIETESRTYYSIFYRKRGRRRRRRKRRRREKKEEELEKWTAFRQIFSIVNESGLAPIKGDVRSDRGVDRACHFGPRVIERSDFPHGSVSTRPTFYQSYSRDIQHDT